jgi:heparan-alpha-glucosaminide N-acetyltransferase
MTNYNRVSSIDIMRGLTLLLMLFVSDLTMKVSPPSEGSQLTLLNNPLLSDWIFTSFLFLAGLAIPFSLSKRFSRGDNTIDISKHIIRRFFSLVVIGVLMLNSGRVDATLTGFSQVIWTLFMYMGIFLIWNDYPNKEDKFFTVTGLKLLGLTILVALVFKFRSGQFENGGSLVTGWWGFLGLIGWGYLVAAFTYVIFRDSVVKTAIVTAFFLGLTIFMGRYMVSIPEIVRSVFGVILDGTVPFIVLSGLVAGLIIKKIPTTEPGKVTGLVAAMGILYLAAGFLLKKWFIMPVMTGIPAQPLIICGISVLVFSLFYWVTDVKMLSGWMGWIRPAGENSLMAFLISNFIGYLIVSSGYPVLVYKLSSSPIIVVAGSLVWSLLMIGLTSLMLRLKIKIKA